MSSTPRSFAFVFPMFSGHINPSLPVARALVELGHEVHYLCREQMRGAIEDTGAAFHSDVEQEPELYLEGEGDMNGGLELLKSEFGLDDAAACNPIVAMFKLGGIALERKLPGVIRWLRAVRADAVMYCPLSSQEAAYAARALDIPSVALLTTAGPGSVPLAFEDFMKLGSTSKESLCDELDAFQPHREAVDRVNRKYSLEVHHLPNLDPLGKMDVLKESNTTLVTTCELLQDPMTPEIEQAYTLEGVRFEAVGPLLDKEGAKRAAGHKLSAAAGEEQGGDGGQDSDAKDLMCQVRAARTAGRPVVLVSMGTVLTGDHTEVGWEGRKVGPDGKSRGLTGRELCRAVWGGAFDALGECAAEAGPLIVVSLGPQPEALGDLAPPANVLCLPMIPQVDILRAGVDAFLTHGGQNSFTEGLANAAPLVVCPGFADQPVNACKAEALGVGLQVPRPDPDAGDEAAAAAQYREDVAETLRRVRGEDAFRRAARDFAERLQQSGGVPRAVEVMLSVAAAGRLPVPSKDEASPTKAAALPSAGAPAAPAPASAGGA